MAIFQGEDMVDVTTPDGRTLTLPRSIVPTSMLPQQQIGQAPPGFADEPIATGPAETPSVTGGQLPTPDVQVPSTAPAPAQPDYQAGVVDNSQGLAGVAKSNKAYEQQQKQQAAQAASPQGKFDAAQGQQAQANQSVADALLSQEHVDEATSRLVADVVSARRGKLDEIDAKKQIDMQSIADAQDKKMGEVVSQRKKIADTKIDRKADHPIALAISAALVGLGEAMQGQKITSGQIITDAIDRKVAAQMADLDQMAKVYGMTKDELADLKDKSKNKLEFWNMMAAGEADKATRQIEELTARSASDKIKANAQREIAALQQYAADKTMESVRWGNEYNQRDAHQKQQIGLGYANLAESRRATDLNAQLKREDMALDMEKYLAGLKAKGDEESFKIQAKQAEEVGKRGVTDANGELLLTSEGRAKMAEAQKLQDESDALEASSGNDPMRKSIASDKVALMRQKAAMLRGDARNNNAVLAHTDTQNVAVSSMIASGQTTVQLIDQIKTLANEVGRGTIQRTEGQAQLQALFKQLAPNLKEAWQLGAWDKGSAKLVEEIIGADPSSDWSAGALGMLYTRAMFENPKSFTSRLDSVADQLENRVRNTVVNLGAKIDPKDKILGRSPPAEFSPSAAKLTQAPSGTELQKNAEQTGVVAKTARAVGYPFSPSHAQEAEQAQSTKYLGLSKAQEAPFEERLQAYKKGDPKAGDDIIRMTAEIAKTRPDLAVPVLQNLQQYASKLYPAARAAIPKDSETEQVISQQEINRIGVSDIKSELLAPQVLSSVGKDGNVEDVEGLKELGRRAAMLKDPSAGPLQKQQAQIAAQALADILQRKTINKSSPAGSVFRGGR